MSNRAHALDRLAFGALTGLGSLPHGEPAAALAIAFSHDVPFLPQLPGLSRAELMIPSALEGLPGLSADGAIDLDGWRRKRDPFGLELDAALASAQLQRFEPSESSCRCFRPFLAEVRRRRAPVAKVQLAGPGAARWARTNAGVAASEVAELDEQIFRLLLARSLALVAAVRGAGATPMIFFDEPGLLGPDALLLGRLQRLTSAAKRAGAVVGIHCCANTDWAAVLALGPDVLSFDARLSLDAVLEQAEAVERFLAEGGRFALGVIPTGPGPRWILAELVDSIEVSLRAATPRFEAVLRRALLTPACGLGTLGILEAERVLGALAEARARLEALLGEPRASPAPPAWPS